PIEAALFPFVKIPEQIDTDRVQPHRLRHLQTMPPVLRRNAGEMEFAAPDDQGFAIEQEILVTDRKRVGGRRRRRCKGRRKCRRQKQQRTKSRRESRKTSSHLVSHNSNQSHSSTSSDTACLG